MRTQRLHKAHRRPWYSYAFQEWRMTMYALCGHLGGKTTRDWKRVTCKNCLRMRKP